MKKQFTLKKISIALVFMMLLIQSIRIDKTTEPVNPATDFIAIENVAGLSYQLMDISGKVILSGTTQLQNQINIADLNAGIYNIRFEKDGAVKAIKVLKM